MRYLSSVGYQAPRGDDIRTKHRNKNIRTQLFFILSNKSYKFQRLIIKAHNFIILFVKGKEGKEACHLYLHLYINSKMQHIA
jgi:hypothetical protein